MHQNPCKRFSPQWRQGAGVLNPLTPGADYLSQLAQDEHGSVSALLVAIFGAHPLQSALELRDGSEAGGESGQVSDGWRRLRDAHPLQ